MSLIQKLKAKIKEHKDGHCCCCHAEEKKPAAAKPRKEPAGAAVKR